MKKTYKIDVDCANCANKMEDAAKKTAGVKDATVNFMTLKMNVEFEEGQDPKQVMQVVRDATFVLASKGIRTEVVLKADIRPGFTDTMTGKLKRMEAQIKKQEEAR